MGVIVWRGPSLLTDEPVKAVLLSLDRPSQNAKTGDEIQVAYAPDREAAPWVGSREGSTRAVCGDCAFAPHMSKGCYVTVLFVPRAAHNTTAEGAPSLLRDARRAPLRFGAWGDPACTPTALTIELAAYARERNGRKAWTGYTHQWRSCDPELRRYLMASVDSETEHNEAKALGWRTFRARWPWDALVKGERICPASVEHGHLSTCARCGQCSGTDGVGHRDFAIIRHDASSVERIRSIALGKEPEPVTGARETCVAYMEARNG